MALENPVHTHTQYKDESQSKDPCQRQWLCKAVKAKERLVHSGEPPVADAVALHFSPML